MRWFAVLALVGCSTDEETIDTNVPCTPYPWFLDADGDGLGDAETAAVTQCEPDPTTGFTASNNTDCDDSDATITAAGPSCPADIAGTAAIVEFAIGTREYLVTFPPTDDPSDGTGVIAMDAVDEICSGWGGAPFVANDEQEIVALNEHVPYDTWAGWVGIVAVADAWTWDDGDAIVDFCEVGEEGDNVVPAHDTVIHLAWVKRDLLADDNGSCAGAPEHAFGFYDPPFSVTDYDNDGLQSTDDPDDADDDVDDDGVIDGQEVDVMGTNPEIADPFPVLAPETDPELAYQPTFAFFACERERP